MPPQTTPEKAMHSRTPSSSSPKSPNTPSTPYTPTIYTPSSPIHTPSSTMSLNQEPTSKAMEQRMIGAFLSHKTPHPSPFVLEMLCEDTELSEVRVLAFWHLEWLRTKWGRGDWDDLSAQCKKAPEFIYTSRDMDVFALKTGIDVRKIREFCSLQRRYLTPDPPQRSTRSQNIRPEEIRRPSARLEVRQPEEYDFDSSIIRAPDQHNFHSSTIQPPSSLNPQGDSNLLRPPSVQLSLQSLSLNSSPRRTSHYEEGSSTIHPPSQYTSEDRTTIRRPSRFLTGHLGDGSSTIHPPSPNTSQNSEGGEATNDYVEGSSIIHAPSLNTSQQTSFHLPSQRQEEQEHEDDEHTTSGSPQSFVTVESGKIRIPYGGWGTWTDE